MPILRKGGCECYSSSFKQWFCNNSKSNTWYTSRSLMTLLFLSSCTHETRQRASPFSPSSQQRPWVWHPPPLSLLGPFSLYCCTSTAKPENHGILLTLPGISSSSQLLTCPSFLSNFSQMHTSGYYKKIILCRRLLIHTKPNPVHLNSAEVKT